MHQQATSTSHPNPKIPQAHAASPLTLWSDQSRSEYPITSSYDTRYGPSFEWLYAWPNLLDDRAKEEDERLNE
ncbi:hypothetical protein FQN50_006278 [Emmonsiellopsis sp. PD_5]|nr:hypothetical protein FQN50_006278 [Emmonsiellopsis sp. PD_5]